MFFVEQGSADILAKNTSVFVFDDKVLLQTREVVPCYGVNRRWIGTPDRHPKGTPLFSVSND